MKAPSQRSQATALYEPLDDILVRTPAFSIEMYQSLYDASSLEAYFDNQPVRLALATASLPLHNELDRTPTKIKDIAHRNSKFLRYLIRMTTRPTPYGMLAGVSLGKWGDTTNITLAATPAVIRTRPDMQWLVAIIQTLEANADLRKHLCFVTNSATFTRGGRIFLHEVSDQQSDPATMVSMRATGAVNRALHLARHPIPYQQLVVALLTAIPGATEEKVASLLDELWKQTFLFTDLRPPLSGANPTRYVRDRLAAIPEAADTHRYLTHILAMLSAWDEQNAAKSMSAAEYQQLVRLMQQADSDRKTPDLSLPAEDSSAGLPTTHKPHQYADIALQTDMALPLKQPFIARIIGDELAVVGETLLHIMPSPRRYAYLEAYRNSFTERYNTNQYVPLLEVIDPNYGIGLPEAMQSNVIAEKKTEKTSLRDKTLLEMALSAWSEHTYVIDLNQEIIKKLETDVPTADTAPPYIELFTFIAASSVASIDAGHFLLVLSPGLGNTFPRSSLGRFADLLGEPAIAAIHQTAQRVEQASSASISAEISYLPRFSRGANIAIRPVARRYEIVVGAHPSVPEDQVIPLDELMLGVQGGHFRLIWNRTGEEVQIVQGHLLNTQAAPSVLRFLTVLGYERVRDIESFSWGPAKNFPFLPRVQLGRVVLKPARWLINNPVFLRDLDLDDAIVFASTLQQWRDKWQVPRYVYLTESDNRLLLDLASPLQREELRRELQLALMQPGKTVILQEGLPAPDQTWMVGPHGHYSAEFVVSLSKKSNAQPEQRDQMAAPITTATTKERLQAPGSNWLFMKLYCGKDLQEDFIAGPLRSFTNEVMHAKSADDWFYIRYADPEPHIRLRFHGDPQTLLEQLLPRLCDWGNTLIDNGICRKFAFDTYDREIERYGGLPSIPQSEALFGADSRAVVTLHFLLRHHFVTLEREALFLLSADDLLAALGVDQATRLAWYRQWVTDRPASGPIYRQNSTLFRTLLSNANASLTKTPGGDLITQTLAARRSIVAPIGLHFAALANQQQLQPSLQSLCRSFLHMHSIRLMGIDRPAEEKLISALWRTHEGLDKAPLR